MGPARSPAGLEASALLLCAHGRGEAAEDHHIPELLAGRLRAAGRFARVEACYLRGSPGLTEVLAGIEAETVFLVPLLMADGHTSQVVLPDALAAAGAPAARVTVTPPVGVSTALPELAERIALAHCSDEGWEPSDTTIVVAAHGTARHAGSSGSAGLLAERMAASGRFRAVAAAFLEQEPFVDARLRAVCPGPCVVIGNFMDHGGHSAEDIPRHIAAEHPGAAYAGAIGAHPDFADIVLDMVAEAAGR